MNICMISSFPPAICGVGDYTFELSNALVQKGVNVEILTYKEHNTNTPLLENISSNLKVHRILSKNISGWKLWKEIKKLSPDLIHLQSTRGLHRQIFNTFALFKYNTPLITTAHDTTVSAIGRIYYFTLNPIYKKSQKVVVHSNLIKQRLIKFHHIEESKIVKMPMGVDVKRFNPEVPTKEFKSRYNLENKFLILFFGFLMRYKGIEYLLKAFKIISTKIPDAKLVIAGGSRPDFFLKGDYKSILEKIMNDLKIEDDVIFTGYVSEHEMPACLACADVVVFPYINVSQSAPLHRAFGTGRPIIATNIGSFPELIENGETGILVPPRNPDAIAKQILQLWGNKELRYRLGKNAREKAENELSWEKISNETKKLYENVLGGH